MALITCPECGKEISNTAESCPHCGYILKKDTQPRTQSTSLNDKEANPVLGAILIAGGIFILIFGLIAFGFIFGIFVAIAAFVMIGLGISKISGSQQGQCPYCHNTVTVPAQAASFKCPYCKKISTKHSDSLERID